MSTLVSVMLPGTSVAAASQIEECARSLGVDLSLNKGLNIQTDTGLIPCTLNGQSAPFELTWDDEGSAGLSTLHLEARASYASYVACAYVAASISIVCKGVVRDEDGEEFSGPALSSWLTSIAPPELESEAEELRIEVSVVGPRGNRLLQLSLGRVPPGAHLARRLVESIDVAMVPSALRTPNSRFIIVVRDASKIVAIEPARSTGNTEA